MKIAKPAIILALLVITAVSWITTDAKYMNVQYLQHLGTLLLMLLLVHGTIKEPMPISAFTCLTIFIFIHIIGARYCYSNVPYEEWFAKLGVVVHNSRNHFDRLVHFSFGVLLFPYLQHKCSSWIEKKPPISIFGAWLLIQTGSMIYELFEWQLAFSIAPKDAETYNGQQGDMWDAQKDMALAMLGSTIMAIYYLFKSKLDIKGQKTDINKTTVVSIVCLIMLGSSGCLSYSHYCYSKRAMAAQVLPEGKNAKPGRIYFASFPENKLALDIWGWHPNVGHAALVTRNNVGLIKQYDYGWFVGRNEGGRPSDAIGFVVPNSPSYGVVLRKTFAVERSAQATNEIEVARMVLEGMPSYGNKVELWAKDVDDIGIAERYMEHLAEDKDRGSMAWRCWQIGGYRCGNITRQAFDAARGEGHFLDLLWGGFPGADAPSIGTDKTVYVKE